MYGFRLRGLIGLGLARSGGLIGLGLARFGSRFRHGFLIFLVGLLSLSLLHVLLGHFSFLRDELSFLLDVTFFSVTISSFGFHSLLLGVSSIAFS